MLKYCIPLVKQELHSRHKPLSVCSIHCSMSSEWSAVSSSVKCVQYFCIVW